MITPLLTDDTWKKQTNVKDMKSTKIKFFYIREIVK